MINYARTAIGSQALAQECDRKTASQYFGYSDQYGKEVVHDLSYYQQYLVNDSNAAAVAGNQLIFPAMLPTLHYFAARVSVLPKLAQYEKFSSQGCYHIFPGLLRTFYKSKIYKTLGTTRQSRFNFYKHLKIHAKDLNLSYVPEGCLSFPGEEFQVQRLTKLRANGFIVEIKNNYEFKLHQFSLIFKDFSAQLFQHETDHLCGVTLQDLIDLGLASRV